MEAFLAWAAAFFGNPLTLLIIGLSVTVLILLYHGYRSIKLRALEQVTYHRTISTDGFFAGETVDLTEVVRNPGWLPLFRVKLATSKYDFYRMRRLDWIQRHRIPAASCQDRVYR